MIAPDMPARDAPARAVFACDTPALNVPVRAAPDVDTPNRSLTHGAPTLGDKVVFNEL